MTISTLATTDAPAGPARYTPVTWWMLLALVMFAAVAGMALFAMRQQRLELMHNMVLLQQQMVRSRQNLWGLQAQIAQNTRPQALDQAIQHAGLQLEPITQPPPTDIPLLTSAQPSHGQ